MNKKIIDLRDFCGHLAKYFWVIFLITTSTTVLSGIVSFYITPIYQAETELMVNMNEISSEDIETNLKLIETYNSIIKSAYIMEAVAQKLQLENDISELAKQVHVQPASKASQVFSIVVENPDQKTAALIANTVAAIFQNEITNIFDVKSAHILTPAKIEDHPSPVKPNKFLYIVAGFLIGLVISTFTVLLLMGRKADKSKASIHINKERR
ncbi:YveK family protein [Thermoflavimicrobium dichotomicum]|uniref:Protein tyrosine kinase EpsB modulator n=1 Tax=Thermoflavimicrobium dichotomicum TaxID=46223 RepID=A0A1I3NAJ7_9BACL|nr:Wzz/FepE/Etk N-terminal domain-containing protein [Thermoflavimicrobium dichotomicum]SFJ06353.1 protein tyrosine kinase EpsB modulator [Thermoflavimicrobium dichotomicum]